MTRCRRERDFEAQRCEWDDEIARLQDSLRKVEAFRRENESKLQPIRLQEEELSDELARQKERDALRKNYIEEMKVRTPHNKHPSRLQVLQLRHEQTKAELLQQLTREQLLHKEDQGITPSNHNPVYLLPNFAKPLARLAKRSCRPWMRSCTTCASWRRTAGSATVRCAPDPSANVSSETLFPRRTCLNTQ